VQRENIDEDEIDRDDGSEKKSGAFKTIEERMAKRRRRASMSKLVFYVIALIMVILLMLWLRGKGM
jgi:hypothetical protein